MSLRLVKPAALALLLAAALLAALFAVAAFAPPRAGAQTDIRNIIEVDGGRSSEMVFKVNPPGSSYLDPDDQIKIDIPTGFILPSNNQVNKDKIGFSGSGDGKTAPLKATTNAIVDGNTLTLTIPPDPNSDQNSTGDTLKERVGTGEHLVITIKANNGITAPKTPKGFDDNNEGYYVDITFVDTAPEPDKSSLGIGTNIIVIKNPVSSTVPGATVRVELATYADAPIGSNQEITVDFSGPSADSEFILPSTIANNRVTIRYTKDDGKAESFSPSDVLVQGAEVILTVPDGREIPLGDYTISFSQQARIKNPYSAGNRTITVSSTAPGDKADDITAIIRRTTTVSPLKGPRGSEFTLEGKGYASGTVTVYHDANKDGKISSGETLASEKTSRGSFKVKLKAGGKQGDPEFRVETRDSYGEEDHAVFGITSTMSFQPTIVEHGSKLKITLSDWQDKDAADELELAVVRIGGEIAYLAELRKYDQLGGCLVHEGLLTAVNGIVSVEVEVPSEVPVGEQTVSLYDHKQLIHYEDEHEGKREIPEDEELDRLCPQGQTTGLTFSPGVSTELRDKPEAVATATIEIKGRALTLSPESAARGQTVVITGSGFSPGGGIERVTIGGVAVAEGPAGFEVESNGDVTLIVTVPTALAVGSYEARVEGANSLATGTLTIPAPSIALDPARSRRGATVSATGSGFIANRPVRLSYGDGGINVGVAIADSQGNFTHEFTVPVTAQIGRSHKVTAVAVGDGPTAQAEAVHSPPAAEITTTPAWVLPGDTLTVRGENLPPFATVRPLEIEGLDVTPGPNPNTDRDGTFEAEVIVPQMSLGEKTLRVEVSGVVVTHIFVVANPPLSGPAADVFRELVRSGVLVRIWQLDPSDQSWTFFDPAPGLADFNTLTEVNSGDFVYVNLNRPARFQEDNLAAGWNIVLLK